MGGPHPSHNTRISDASSFDEICIYCGAHDEIGSWGNLVYPCSKAPKEPVCEKVDEQKNDEIKDIV